MLPPSAIFLSFVLPALIVAAGLALGWWVPRRWRNSGRGTDGRWVGAVAVGGAFAAAQCAVAGAPRDWPWVQLGDVSNLLVWFTVPVAALGVADALLRPPTWLRALVLLLVARLGLRAFLGPLTAHPDPDALWSTPWSLETWLDGFSGAIVLWWLATEEQAERMAGAVAPTVLAMVLGGSAAVLGLSGNVKPSLEAVALAAMAAAAAVMAWPLRRLSLSRGAVLAFVVPLFGLFALVHFYAYTQPPAVSCALLGVAPLLAWTADLPGARRLRRGRVLLRLVPVGLAVGLAVALAAREAMHSPMEQNRSSTSEGGG